MATKFSICSEAFIGLGANTIANFDIDPSTGQYDSKEKKVAATRYDTIKESELTGHLWNFNTFVVELSREAATPPQPWTYQYLEPSDMLRLIRCETTEGEGIEYRAEGGRIYADESRVVAKYIADVAEADMPPFFVNLLVARLRWEFAGPLRDEGSKQERFLKEYQLVRREAKRTDSQSNPPRRVYAGNNSTWLAARRG